MKKEEMNLEDKIENMEAELQNMKKMLTMQKGVGVEDGQDGNRGDASAETGEQDYSKFEHIAKKKMLIKSMME